MYVGARRTNISLKIKIEIPVSGQIKLQQNDFKLDQLHSWPHNLETGWTAKYGRLGMSFEEIRQQLQRGQFTFDAFRGPDSHAFQWGTNVWDTSPYGWYKFWKMWDQEGHINHPKRSYHTVTDKEKEQIRLKTPAHQP